MVGGPADRVCDAGGVAAAVRAEHLEWHEARERRHPRDSDAVAGALRDRPRHVGSVSVIVPCIRAAGEEVVPSDDSLGIEVVDGRDAGVEDGDGDSRAARRVPGRRRADRLEVPLLGEVGIVGLPQPPHPHHRLREVDVGARTQRGERFRLASGIDAQDDELLGIVDVVDRIVLEALVLDDLAETRREGVVLFAEPFEANVDEAGHDVRVALLRDGHGPAAASREAEEQQDERRDQCDDGALRQARARAQSGKRSHADLGFPSIRPSGPEIS